MYIIVIRVEMNKIKDSNIDKVELIECNISDGDHRVVDAVRCDRYDVIQDKNRTVVVDCYDPEDVIRAVLHLNKNSEEIEQAQNKDVDDLVNW